MNTAAIDNPYFDAIISLVMVYAFLSILVSVLLEAWNKRTKERGVFLQKVIFRLLDDPLNRNYGYAIYQHPIINKMRKDGDSYPHYIPAEGFANALIDTLAEQALTVHYIDGPDNTYTKDERGRQTPLAERLQEGVRLMNDSEFKRLLTNFIDRNKVALNTVPSEAEKLRLDLDKLKLELGHWYDDFMDRSTGEFKNNQRGKLQLLGLAVAVMLNVDSLHLARVFLLDKDLRDRMVERAEATSDAIVASKDTSEAALRVAVLRKLTALDTGKVKRTQADTVLMRALAVVFDDSTVVREKQQSDSLLAVLDQWQLPMGWSCTEAPLSWVQKEWCACESVPPTPRKEILLKYFTARNERSLKQAVLWFFGVLITGFSLSLGAPFWFDALVKLINIRRSGLKPKTTDQRNA